MSAFTAKEAAAQLNTDGKTLRRFLRSAPDYVNAGSGGRYTFTDDDMPKLRDLFNAWRGRPRRPSMIVDEPGLPARVARSRSPHDLAAVRAISEQRIDRLEQALRERGLHISQMREREGWATVSA